MIGKIDSKVVLMGLLHSLVAFPAITVVTLILGFNLPIAFLFAGIGTILFHIITKNKLPVTLGVSALYIGSILFVVENYGKEYAFGGIVVSGLLYILFGLIMLKYQYKILEFFPAWLLSTAILMIGLTLLPIGVGLMKESILIGASALVATALVDVFGGKRLGMLAMPVGIVVGTVVAFFTTGLEVVDAKMVLEFTTPRFNIESALTIGLVSLAVMFEMMGDTKNIGHIIGRNAFKEVGVGRISLGNGISSVLGGMFGANAYTTYSENAGFLILTKYYNPTAQLFTGLFFILFAFFTPVLSYLQAVPMAVFGGVITYLFAMIAVNSVRQIAEVGIEDNRVFSIIVTMLSLSFLTYTFNGISLSSVAIAVIVGVILNTVGGKVRV